MNRTKLTLIGSVAAILIFGAVIFALGSGDAQALYGPGRTSRGAMGTGGPTPTPTPYVCPQSIPVQIINSPSPSNGQNDDQLNGVVALTSTNIWAVGSSAGRTQALIEHDDGTGWVIIPSPTPVGSQENVLHGIAAVSASDIWAVGETTPITGGNFAQPQPLVEHWNGTSWSLVSSPVIPNTIYNFTTMYAVSALATNDVWAVGSEYFPASGNELLVEHWDGTQWNVVPVPMQSGTALLNSLAVLSDSNIWAVGTYYAGSKMQTLIEHYDGTSWSIITSPSPGGWSNTLTGVVATSATSIWAVGYSSDYNGEPYDNQTLVEHWNGTSWSVVPSPNPGAYNSIFQAAGADSNGDIWVAGSYQGYTGPALALVERWNGTSWTQFAAPGNSANGAYDFQLNGIAVLSRLNVWFVGFDYGNSAHYQTLAAHYPRPFLGINCPPA